MPWRNQASTNYTNRAFYSEKDATEDYFTLRKPKVPGRGGKTCRWRHDKKPWVPSEKKERFASLSYLEYFFREEEKIFSIVRKFY